jgi:protein XRP2
VIGLHYNGDGVCQACQEINKAVSEGSAGPVFISNSPQVAAQQIEDFYNYANMQMTV